LANVVQKTQAAASAGMSSYSAYQAVTAGQGKTIDGKANQVDTGQIGSDQKPTMPKGKN